MITRCTAEDMEELIKLTYKCFPPSIRLLFMGCHDEDDIPKYTEMAIKIMQEDPNDIWIGVRDIETGKFIAGSNWKVYLNGNVSVTGEDEIPKWLEGEDLATSQKLIGEMAASRTKNMPGPYICKCILRNLPSKIVAEMILTFCRPAHLFHGCQVPSARRWRNDDPVGLRSCGPALPARIH